MEGDDSGGALGVIADKRAGSASSSMSSGSKWPVVWKEDKGEPEVGALAARSR
jgi:hypothetical protein